LNQGRKCRPGRRRLGKPDKKKKTVAAATKPLKNKTDGGGAKGGNGNVRVGRPATTIGPRRAGGVEDRGVGQYERACQGMGVIKKTVGE